MLEGTPGLLAMLLAMLLDMLPATPPSSERVAEAAASDISSRLRSQRPSPSRGRPDSAAVAEERSPAERVAMSTPRLGPEWRASSPLKFRDASIDCAMGWSLTSVYGVDWVSSVLRAKREDLGGWRSAVFSRGASMSRSGYWRRWWSAWTSR